MADSLDYIRQSMAKDPSAKVYVTRWEKDTRTGYYSSPVKVLMTPHIALAELSKPLNKRSYIWRQIRPLGMSMDGNIAAPTGNRLNDPELIEQLKAELKLELAAEMGLNLDSEEKPKRRRKTVEVEKEQDDTTIDDFTDLENA